MVEDAEGHDGARLAVVDAVDKVADIVEVTGDFCNFDGTIGITKGG